MRSDLTGKTALITGDAVGAKRGHYLVSDLASFVTDEVGEVNGGLRFARKATRTIPG